MNRRSVLKVLFSALVVILLLGEPSRATQAAIFDTFIVDSTDDSDTRPCTTAPDDCTLRGAINDANASANLCAAIYFTAPSVILNSPLPPLQKNCLIVDGTDGNGNYVGPRIDGLLMSTPGDGLVVEANQSVTISNLKIVNIPAGHSDIFVFPTNPNVSDIEIADNSLGIVPGATNCTGSRADAGIYIWATVQTFSGATHDPLYIFGNVISCNTVGISMSAITPGPGGATFGPGHVNIGRKPDFSVAANYIGTTSDGTGALGNSNNGIQALYPSFLDVRGNIISGNGYNGIQLESATSTAVEQNKIGTDATGTLSLPNVGAGIAVDQNPSTFIRSNLIANNGSAGVLITGADSHTLVQQNDIYSNASIPIGLGGVVFFPNGTKVPPGPNNWIPYPVITGNTGNVLQGTACAGCSIDIYTAVGDPTTSGGGGKFLDEFVANGSGTWSYTLASSFTGPFVAVTATDAGHNTSEFSPRFNPTGLIRRLFLPLLSK